MNTHTDHPVSKYIVKMRRLCTVYLQQLDKTPNTPTRNTKE